MARINDMAPEQKAAAYQMKSLRLQIGMTMPKFGKAIGMDSRNVAARESMRVSWKESELQSALPDLVNHLKESLKQAETLANTFSPQPTTKTK
jgi:transcriptional regulator with XRE-family HTH domain